MLYVVADSPSKSGVDKGLERIGQG
jgi:hypothetical protein